MRPQNTLSDQFVLQTLLPLAQDRDLHGLAAVMLEAADRLTGAAFQGALITHHPLTAEGAAPAPFQSGSAPAQRVSTTLPMACGDPSEGAIRRVSALPFKRSEAITLRLFVDPRLPAPATSNLEPLWVATYVTALGAIGSIDELTLESWLRALVGRTPEELVLLQDIVAMRRSCLASLAERTGIDTATLRAQIALLAGPEAKALSFETALLELVKTYGFLNWAQATDPVSYRSKTRPLQSIGVRSVPQSLRLRQA